MTDSEPRINKLQSNKANRRHFLKTSTVAGAIAAAPAVLPASVLGREGATAPNDKIVLAGLGVGRRGSDDLRYFLREEDVQFVANCDPQKERALLVKKMVDARDDNSDCKLYSHIDEFLANHIDGVDAVLSTTGDRWHALAATKAMRAGLDVYSEKPSSMTIAEGQEVVKAAERYGRVYQTGTQRLSEANFIFCQELLQRGMLGKVHTVRAHIAPWDAAIMNYHWREEQEEPPKDECDWDHWLGPCPWRPYNKRYVEGGWRGFYDFHTSCIGEWGAHTFASCQVAMDAWETSAIEYPYVENEKGDGMVTKFANGINMVLQLEGWNGSCGARYEGSEGWCSTSDGNKLDVSNSEWLKDYDKIVDEYTERTKRQVRGPMRHIRNFLDCIKTREQPVANPVMMHRTMTTVHAANIAMWLKRDMKYDPIKEEFINDDEANRLRSRAQRGAWTF